MIITIGRECGCDGDEVAARLASKYGIACYTKKEIIRLAKEKGVYDKYPFFFGEKAIDSMMQSVSDDFVVKRRKTPEDVLERLLDGQDGVVVGRASDFAFLYTATLNAFANLFNTISRIIPFLSINFISSSVFNFLISFTTSFSYKLYIVSNTIIFIPHYCQSIVNHKVIYHFLFKRIDFDPFKMNNIFLTPLFPHRIL
jgi:hypothetical protein